jgi:hypothetical protein
MEMVAPARAGAADRSDPLAHLHRVARLERGRAEHVQVHEGVLRLGAPDRDVVAAAAVVALLDDAAVANRNQRRPRGREHVLALVHVAAAVRAEASVGLAPVRIRAHGKDRRGTRGRAFAHVLCDLPGCLERRRERYERGHGKHAAHSEKHRGAPGTARRLRKRRHRSRRA